MSAVNSPEAVFLYGVVPAVTAVTLTFGWLVLRACWTNARRRRADVRATRARGYALFREDSGPADWQAVQDAVNRVHQAADEIADADFDLWRIENGWQSA